MCGWQGGFCRHCSLRPTVRRGHQVREWEVHGKGGWVRQLHCTMKPCHAAKPPCAGMPCQQSVLQLRVTMLLPHARAPHQWIVLQLCKTAQLGHLTSRVCCSQAKLL